MKLREIKRGIEIESTLLHKLITFMPDSVHKFVCKFMPKNFRVDIATKFVNDVGRFTVFCHEDFFEKGR